MKYCVNLGCWNSVFAVPSSIVDEHIKLAGAASLKVLLYVLRHSGEEVDVQPMAENLSLSEEDTADALGYWITCGVLARRGNNLTAGEAANSESVPVAEREMPKAESVPAVKKQKKEKISYNFDECADIMTKDSSIAEMLLAVESMLAKQLTHREVSLYVTLTHWYGFDPKLVPMLLHYCRASGTLSASYIEATGLGWIEEGIDTIEKAEEKVSRKTGSRRAWKIVSGVLEIDRAKPSVKEEAFSNAWINDWKMPPELINEAYERCVNKKGKLSFSYMNGIMERWHAEGVNTLQKLREHEEKDEKKSKKTTSGRYEPTYDKSEIDKFLWDDMLDTMAEDDQSENKKE